MFVGLRTGRSGFQRLSVDSLQLDGAVGWRSDVAGDLSVSDLAIEVALDTRYVELTIHDRGYGSIADVTNFHVAIDILDGDFPTTRHPDLVVDGVGYAEAAIRLLSPGTRLKS